MDAVKRCASNAGLHPSSRVTAATDTSIGFSCGSTPTLEGFITALALTCCMMHYNYLSWPVHLAVITLLKNLSGHFPPVSH